jgi:hypothetical protein
MQKYEQIFYNQLNFMSTDAKMMRNQTILYNTNPDTF